MSHFKLESAVFNNILSYVQSDYTDILLIEGHAHACVIIEESGLPIEVQEKMKFIIANLAFSTSSVQEIWSMDDKDIPGSLVLGGTEILVGALVHLIPGCGWLGKAMIADGVRRVWNGFEEGDAKNRKVMEQSFFDTTQIK